MKHKIRFILLLLAMIPLSTWAQSEGYNPENPGDPEMPQAKYLVSVKAEPANAATFNISNERYAAGSNIYIQAYPQSGFRVKQWVVDGTVMPTTKDYIEYTVPEHASQIVAHFVYDPGSPSNPGKNYWNKETGEVIMDDFTPGSLASSITNMIDDASYTDVKKITVTGKITTEDLRVANSFPGCMFLDLSRTTGVTEIPSYTFYDKNLVSIYLPNNVEKIGFYAFAYSKKLSSITLNETTPPSVSVSDDAFLEVSDTMVVYVPEKALSLYQEHEVWGKLNLKAFTPPTSRIQLQGDIIFKEDSTYRFVRQNVEPEWQFTNPEYSSLREGVDYYVSYTDNYYPGTATLTVVGIGDYIGKLQKQFNIEKGILTKDQYEVYFPDSTLTYDAYVHDVTAYGKEGVGKIQITYREEGDTQVMQSLPKDPGTYDVYMEIAEGTFYLGKEIEKIGSFTIHKMDEKEWQTLVALNEALDKMGNSHSWYMDDGPVGVTQLKGVTVKSGHVTALDLSYRQLKGELPLAAMAFPKLESLNVSFNELTGNLGLLGKVIPTLKELNASYNGFSDVVPMLPTTITQLDISNQTIDRTIELDASNYNVAQLIKQIPTILVYDHQNQGYNTTNLSCLLTTADGPNWYSKWAVMLNYQNGKLTMPYVTTPSEYYGESGDILHLVKLNNDWGHSMDGSNLKVKYIFPQGDANFKPGVDATDVQATVLYAFGDYTNLPFNFTAADTFKDGLINVQDVICTVNILLGEAVSQAKAHQKKAYLNTYSQDIASQDVTSEDIASEDDASEDNANSLVSDAKASIYLEDGKVMLSTETPVAALCIKASGNISWNLDVAGMEQATAEGSLVGYSLTHATLAPGENVIGTYTGSPTLVEASLSDPEAQTIPAKLGKGTSTAIKGISIDGTSSADDSLNEASQAETFNAQGMKTSKMQKGINIVKKNGNIRKVINK